MHIIRNVIYSILIIILTSSVTFAVENVSQTDVANKSESIQSDKSTSKKLSKREKWIIKRIKWIIKKKEKGNWFWPFGLTGILSVVFGIIGYLFINNLWAIILALIPWAILVILAMLIYFLFREA